MPTTARCAIVAPEAVGKRRRNSSEGTCASRASLDLRALASESEQIYRHVSALNLVAAEDYHAEERLAPHSTVERAKDC